MLQTLRNIIQEVSSAADLGEALGIVVRRIKEAMQTDAVSIFLVDTENQENVLMATEGLNKKLIGKARLPLQEGLIGLVAERAQMLNLEDASKHPNFHYIPEIGEEKYKAFLAVPIIHQRQLLGVLVAQQQASRRFDEEEEAFLMTLASQLAGAIAVAYATGMLRELKSGGLKDTVFTGLSGAPGIAIGKVVVVYPLADLEAVPDRVPTNVDAEIKAFDKAIKTAQKEFKKLSTNIANKLPAEEKALFDVYLHILSSRNFSREVKKEIRQGNWAQGALRRVINRHMQHFEVMEDSYLRERATDLQDLGQRILFQLQSIERRKPQFPTRTVLVGEEVSPAALAEVPEGRLVGIISVRGSGSSHVAVLARALNIPAVMGVSGLTVAELEGQEVIIDGHHGQIYLSPSRTLRREFQILIKEERELDQQLEALRELPAQTSDGREITLMINLGLIANIQRSIQRGAQGVGLYRTEIPFMMRDAFPSEEEQRSIYHSLLEAFFPHPVMMRTLDVGGDKSLPYFPVTEDNPFLGWRGIRITLDHPEIFIVQLRAMLRASVGLNNLQIMLPMVSTVTEVEETLQLLQQAYQELRQEGLDVVMPKIGVMIEVPSAIYQVTELANAVDFLSIGSNDLTQYLLAVDRNNPRVANLFDSLHPAVLRALQTIVKSAHEVGKPVSLCGEMAGDPASLILLLGMGFDSLSMSGARLLRAKWVIRTFSSMDCRFLLEKALNMSSAEEVRLLLDNALAAAGLGILIRTGK